MREGSSGSKFNQFTRTPKQNNDTKKIYEHNKENEKINRSYGISKKQNVSANKNLNQQNCSKLKCNDELNAQISLN